MSGFKFSAIFTAATLGASFDAMIERDAQNGQVNAAFLQALDAQYKTSEAALKQQCTIAKPSHFVRYVGILCTSESKPTGVKVDYVQALHAAATMLMESGKGVKGCTLAPLPAWADAAALELAAEVRKAGKLAAKQAKEAILKAKGISTDGKPAPVDAPDKNGALNIVLAALASNAYDAPQVARLSAALAKHSQTGQKATQTRGKGKPVPAVAPTGPAPDTALQAAQAGVVLQ